MLQRSPRTTKRDPMTWLGLGFLILLLPAAWFVYSTYEDSNFLPSVSTPSSPAATESKGSSLAAVKSSTDEDDSSDVEGVTKTSTASPSTSTGTSNSSCFPLGDVTFPSSGAPTSFRSEWWCPDSLMYGFLGFSYPLEVAECSDPSNGLEMITKDLKRMKEEFGATMVRVYGNECREVILWEHLVTACMEIGMGLIVLVWWGFGDDPEGAAVKTTAAIEALFTTSDLADVAPYVVHSASFGSEPIGDGVGGGGEKFVELLKSFRTTMQGFEVPVGISEDWNRESLRKGDGLATLGEEIVANTDIVHAHSESWALSLTP